MQVAGIQVVALRPRREAPVTAEGAVPARIRALSAPPPAEQYATAMFAPPPPARHASMRCRVLCCTNAGKTRCAACALRSFPRDSRRFASEKGQAARDGDAPAAAAARRQRHAQTMCGSSVQAGEMLERRSAESAHAMPRTSGSARSQAMSQKCPPAAAPPKRRKMNSTMNTIFHPCGRSRRFLSAAAQPFSEASGHMHAVTQ